MLALRTAGPVRDTSNLKGDQRILFDASDPFDCYSPALVAEAMKSLEISMIDCFRTMDARLKVLAGDVHDILLKTSTAPKSNGQPEGSALDFNDLLQSALVLRQAEGIPPTTHATKSPTPPPPIAGTPEKMTPHGTDDASAQVSTEFFGEQPSVAPVAKKADKGGQKSEGRKDRRPSASMWSVVMYNNDDKASVVGSVLRRIILSKSFEYFVAFLLIVNSGFLGIQVHFQYLNEDPPSLFVIDLSFSAAFILELFSKVVALGCAGFYFGEDWRWAWFDTFIVGVSTFDTVMTLLNATGEDSPLQGVSVLRMIRVLRLIRMLRILRVLKFFKDLRVMIMAIACTMKTAVWALLLVFSSMYIFAIGLGQFASGYIRKLHENNLPLDEDVERYWGSLSSCMLTLLMSIIGGIDWETAYWPLADMGVMACVLFLVYIMFALFCMMNVIIGIFCHTAIETYAQDTENVIQHQLQEKARFTNKLKSIFAEWDLPGGNCTRREFEAHIQDPNLVGLLGSMDIEPRDAIVLYRMLGGADEEGAVDLDEYVRSCIAIRGAAKAVHLERANIELSKAAFALVEQASNLGQIEVLRVSLQELDQKLDAFFEVFGSVQGQGRSAGASYI